MYKLLLHESRKFCDNKDNSLLKIRILRLPLENHRRIIRIIMELHT